MLGGQTYQILFRKYVEIRHENLQVIGDDNRIVGLSSGSISDFKDILRPYSLKRYLPENTTLHDISPKKDRTLFRIVEANQTPPQVIHNLQEMPLVLGKEKINHMVFLLDAKNKDAIWSSKGGYLITRNSLCNLFCKMSIDANDDKKKQQLYESRAKGSNIDSTVQIAPERGECYQEFCSFLQT